MVKSLVILIIMCGVSLVMGAQEDLRWQRVIPVPRQVEQATDDLSLSDGVDVCLLGAGLSDIARFVAEDMVAALQEVNVSAQLLEGKAAEAALADVSSRSRIRFLLGHPASVEPLQALCEKHGLRLTAAMEDEGYALHIGAEGVVLAAVRPAGLLYGVQTLRQLLRRSSQGVVLPRGRVHDWPILRLRGIMKDTSRGQINKLETAKQIIDNCALFKINLYCPYIETTFAWEGYDPIWKGGVKGYWTADEYAQLSRYARLRHVMIVPQMNTLAHQTDMLCHERYNHLANHPRWPDVFDVGLQESYTMLADLLGQMVPVFSKCPYFGIGGDEAGLSLNQPSEVAYGGVGQTLGYHAAMVQSLLDRHDRRAMMWADMVLGLPESWDLIPRKVMMLWWYYYLEPHTEHARRLRDAGFDVLACPSLLDGSKIFPHYEYAFENIQKMCKAAQDLGLVGTLNTMWGDGGNENFVDCAWLGLAWGAACSWNRAADQDREDLLGRFGPSFFGSTTDAPGRAQRALIEVMNTAFIHRRAWHEDPFSGKAARLMENAPEDIAAMHTALQKAHPLLDLTEKEALRNHQVFPYLRFAWRRLDYLRRRAEEFPQAARAYVTATETSDTGARNEWGRKSLTTLQSLRSELARQRADYLSLWEEGNKPDTIGAVYPASRYDFELEAYDRRIVVIEKALAGGDWPAPAKIQMRPAQAGPDLTEPAMKGDLPTVAKYLDEGADVNTRQFGSYFTPLQHAARAGHADMVRLLIANGAEVNVHAGNAVFDTPLHFAAESNRLEVMRILLEHGADVRMTGRFNRLALHAAAASGHAEAVQILLEAGSPLNIIEGNDGQSPLHLAARHGHPAVADALLAAGASLKARNLMGWTPLHSAVWAGRLDVVRKLLNAGADPTAKDIHRADALDLALQRGYPEVAKALLEKGAKGSLHAAAFMGDIQMMRHAAAAGENPDIAEPIGVTPLHLAASQGHAEAVAFLVQQGADTEATTAEGHTPLHLAAMRGHTAATEALLDHGAKLDAKDISGRTPLHHAVIGGHDQTIRVLRAHGASADTTDVCGYLPIHFAAAMGHGKIIPMLPRKGLDAAQASGMTPLHLAAAANQTDCVTLLLFAGAKVNAQDKTGRTPLHLAAARGRDAAAKLLLAHGADVTLRDKTGKTPLNVVKPESELAAIFRVTTEHHGINKAINLVRPPHPAYADNGTATLTDGILASAQADDPRWSGYWLGFQGEDFEAVVDLGRPIVIRSLNSEYLRSMPSGIHLPVEVRYALSDDGTVFREVATVPDRTPQDAPGVMTEQFEATVMEKARFVRVRAVNVGKIPDWAQAAGVPAWLFVDEIIVNP